MAASSGIATRMGSGIGRAVCLGLMLLLVSACAATVKDKSDTATSRLELSGLVIENASSLNVSAVRLLVPATGNFVSCGNIAPQAKCSTTFPERAHTGNAFEITWSQSGNIWSTGELVLEAPADWEDGTQAMVRVVIAGPGSAGAELVKLASP